jgi:hypothetical protein
VIEALKLAFNVLVRFRSGEVEGPFRKTTQGRSILWDASRDVDFEEQPLRGLDGVQDAEGSAVPARGGGVAQEPPPDAALTRRSWLTVAFASGVWASTTYVVRHFLTVSAAAEKAQRLMETYLSQFSSALNFFDPPTVQITSATSTVLVVYGLYAFSGRGITAALSQNIALQVRPSPVLPLVPGGGSPLWFSFLAFCSPRSHYHNLPSHISLPHSSSSPSPSPVPVMSSSLIMYLSSPLTRISTDGEGRFIVLILQLYTIDSMPSCLPLDSRFILPSAHFRRSPCPRSSYQIGPCTVYHRSS